MIAIFKNVESEFFVTHFELKGKQKEDDPMMDALKQALLNEFPNEKINFYIPDVKDKTDALREFTQKHNIEMIGFIAHKTNIFKNLFSHEIHKKDFFKLELPMLALHE